MGSSTLDRPVSAPRGLCISPGPNGCSAIARTDTHDRFFLVCNTVAIWFNGPMELPTEPQSVTIRPGQALVSGYCRYTERQTYMIFDSFDAAADFVAECRDLGELGYEVAWTFHPDAEQVTP